MILSGTRAKNALLLTPAAVAVVVLFAGAAAGLVRSSLISVDGEVSLAAWRGLLEDEAFADGLRFTLQVAVASTVVSALAALLLAVGLRRRGSVVRALLALPVPMPHLLAATAAVVWLGPGGLAERLLDGLPFDLVRSSSGAGIVLVYVYKEIPFLVVLLLAAAGPELTQREEAARVLGLSYLQRLRWVIWPALRGPLVVGSIIVGAYVIGSFEVPLLVGPNFPPTLATFALEATQGDVLAGQATAAATLAFATALSMLLAAVAVRLARDVEGR